MPLTKYYDQFVFHSLVSSFNRGEPELNGHGVVTFVPNSRLFGHALLRFAITYLESNYTDIASWYMFKYNLSRRMSLESVLFASHAMTNLL